MNRTLTVLVVSLSAAMLSAQTGPVAPTANDAADAPASTARRGSEEDVVLSPFLVNAEADTGYAAQNTLAGSRLRSNLKDVAAPISPMTKEFLDDIAATSISEASDYGVGTRMETDDARAAGPVSNDYNDNTRTIRIRGIGGGTRTVDYFKSYGEVDLYNTERLKVSRGPNSILYGFGSPAGLINASTKTANPQRLRFETSLRVDSWDGNRETFDANIPLIKDKLAIRAIYLRGEEGSWRRAGYLDQDRIYLTGTWKPDAKTNIRVNFENANISRYVPRPAFGVDLLSPWLANPSTMTNFGTGNGPGNPRRDAVSPFPNLPGIREISANSWVVFSDAFTNPGVNNGNAYSQNYRRFTESDVLANSATVPNDFAHGLTNPEAVLEANWVGGEFKQRNVSFAVTRELLRGLNVEISAKHETYKSDTHNVSSWNTIGLNVDPNQYYPDSLTPKPSGSPMYYFEMRPDHRSNDEAQDQARAVLSYETEIPGIGAHLRLAGMAEWSKRENRFLIQEQFWMNGPELTSGGAFNSAGARVANGDPLGSENRVYQRFYVSDPSVLNDPSYRIPAPYGMTGPVAYRNPVDGTVSNIYSNWLNRSQGNINFYDEELRSRMAVGQLTFLRDHVVVTSGYRQDTLSHFESLPVLPGDNAAYTLSGSTKTIGGVAHLTRLVSVFINTSSSRNVPDTQRLFSGNSSLFSVDTNSPMQEGTSVDYGFKLDLIPGGRLFATGTFYHTEAQKNTAFSNFTGIPGTSTSGGISNIWNVLATAGTGSLLTTGTTPPATTADAAAAALSMNRINGYLYDSDSKGFEFEIVGQPLTGLSISMNYSREESTRTNMAQEVRSYIDTWKPLWLQARDYNTTQTAAAGIERSSFQDFNTPAVIAATGIFNINTDSINERIVQIEDLFFKNIAVFDGQRFVGDPKDSIKARIRYDLPRASKLKGLSIGAGARMTRGRIAGAVATWEFAPGSSYTDANNGRRITGVRLIEAEDQTLVDFQLTYRHRVPKTKIDWSIQLNVSNVFDANALIVNSTNAITGDPLTYRYQDPRKFILTNTFRF